MRKLILATIASVALAGTAMAQSGTGQQGATGAGNAPAAAPSSNHAPMGTSETTGGSQGTGHGPSNPNGAGTNMSNAVQNLSPQGPANSPTSR